MPNWCENTLTISGDKSEVLRFVEQAGRKHAEWHTIYTEGEPTQEYVTDLNGLFWNFVTPPVEAQTVEDYFSNDNSAPHYWYNWNVNNWGTKWDVRIGDDLPLSTYEDKASICVSFDTAWSPAIEAYFAMSKQYPSLNIFVEYSELGMGFWGDISLFDGEIVDENEGETDHDWYLGRYGECPDATWDGDDECAECKAINEGEPLLTKGGEE